MRAVLTWLAIVGCSFSGGCSLLLDFDKLEGPQPRPTECSDCVDACSMDPQSDACRAPEAGTPETCTDDQAGLVSATTFEPLQAQHVGRTQVLFTADGLYHVAHIEDDEQQDVVVRAFQPGGDAAPVATLRLSEATADGEMVAGPAALIAPDTGGPLTLYVALKRPGDALAYIKRLTLSSDSLTPDAFVKLTEIPNYFTAQVGPAAGLLNDNNPFVVWHGCRSAESSVSDTTPCPTDGAAIFGHAVIDPTLTVSDLVSGGLLQNAALQGLVALSGSAHPAAAWLTSNALGTEQPAASVGMGVPSSQVLQDVRLCHTEPGYWGLALSGTPLLGERSSIAWSKSDGTRYITEATAVSCRSGGCTDTAGSVDGGECSALQQDRRVMPGVTGLAQASLSASNALDGPQLSAWVETSGTASTTLSLQLYEGNSDPNTTAPLDERSLSRVTLVTAQGPAPIPESPVLAVLGTSATSGSETEVVAVGWTQPSGVIDLAQMRSFHLCPQR